VIGSLLVSLWGRAARSIVAALSLINVVLVGVGLASRCVSASSCATETP
jgi:hypothetical protein